MFEPPHAGKCRFANPAIAEGVEFRGQFTIAERFLEEFELAGTERQAREIDGGWFTGIEQPVNGMQDFGEQGAHIAVERIIACRGCFGRGGYACSLRRDSEPSEVPRAEPAHRGLLLSVPVYTARNHNGGHAFPLLIGGCGKARNNGGCVSRR